MAFNGSGTYVLPGAALVDGQTISATEHNSFRNDVATALTTCVTRDGQSPATANLPMGGFKLTGLAAGSGAGESVRYEQFASPPAIGGTAPAAGTFTTLIADNTAIVNDFRLSLTTGVPVTSTDVTGATTIYCTPFTGNRISLKVGSTIVTRTSAEFSIALGTLTANLPYDVFCYDNSGTPTLELLAWTNDTTRATNVILDASGWYAKSGDPTRRYLGSFYTTATTTTEDSYAKRLLFNAYNQVRRPMRKTDSTASWTYTTATYRYANNSAANRLEYMAGLNGLSADITCNGRSNNSTGDVNMTTAIGFDSGTAAASGGSIAQMSSGAGASITGTAKYNTTLTNGFHFFAWLENSAATGTTTWQANSNNGIQGEVMA